MQRLIALERDYDVTIGVPAVLGEMFRDRFCEHSGDALLATGHAVMISFPQRHDVVVGSKLSTTGQLTNVVLTFPLKRQRNFLRDDVATEHPREGIAHETFKAPIETLN